MGISFYSRGLAIAALALSAGFAAIGMPSLYAGPSVQSDSGIGNKALGLNMGAQAMKESAAMSAMLFGQQSGSYVKTRGPGERAHRRWRHARASGIKGAHRG